VGLGDAHAAPSPAADAGQLATGGRALARKRATAGELFPQWLLNVGFVCGLLLAAVCLVFSAFYLYYFLTNTSAAVENILKSGESSLLPTELIDLGINARMVMARIALHSCGVFVGMAFGFLGFSLFLLGIKGEMDLDAGAESYKVKIARLSPGVFVILCATVLIGVCATSSTPFRGESRTRETFEPAGAQGAVGSPADGAGGGSDAPRDAGQKGEPRAGDAAGGKNAAARPAGGYTPPDPGPAPTRQP
jgi:hypothetical protein